MWVYLFVRWSFVVGRSSLVVGREPSPTGQSTERQAQIRVQLAASLTGIVYQQLLPKIGGGLVAAFEVLVATHADER